MNSLIFSNKIKNILLFSTKNHNIIAISSGSFPYGGAAENRHISYLTGLVQLGCSVKVFLMKQAKEQSKLSNKPNGGINGIKYTYCNWEKKKDNILNSGFLLLRYYKQIKKELNNINSSCNLLILSTDPLSLFLFTRLAKRKNIKIFHERTEYPFINKSGIRDKLSIKLYYLQLRKLDGLFVITKNLKDFFSKYLNEHKIKHIPMTVEPERFDIPKSNSEYGNYIAYCGSMYTDKDGVPILIDAFDKFADKFVNINLVLIGDNSNELLFAPIQKKISLAKNKDRIILTGQVDRDQMPELLCNASSLALARPDNIQAQGGFPTKLGEYLATENPVVVTKVGEIPQYLKDGENAYMAEPDSIDSFAQKLEELYQNYARAEKIGKKGHELVNDVFNYKVQAKALLSFMFN